MSKAKLIEILQSLRILLLLLLLLFSFGLFSLLLTKPKTEEIKVVKNLDKIKYVAAVLPHHLLAESFIDDFISRLDYSPKKIYIIGPNHPEAGQSIIVTNENSESRNLLNTGLVKVDNQIIEKEHSVTVFQDKFKDKFPNTPVIPLVISSRASLDEIDKISNYINNNISSDTLIICSIDFSHYLLLADAESRDKETLALIVSKNYSKIFNLNNDNVDSSKSLLTLLKTLDLTGKNNLVNLNHSNSALLLQNQALPSTTSYFELAFY